MHTEPRKRPWFTLSGITMLLAGAIAQAGPFAPYGDIGERGRGETPSRFLRVELLGGTWETPPVIGGELSLLGVEYSTGRWRAGITTYTLFDMGQDPDMRTQALAQVRLGYTVLRRPQRTAFLYAMLPEVLVGTEGGFLPRPNGRLFVRAQADGLGLGAGAEAGVMVLSYWGSPADYRVGLYVALRFNLLVFNIGL